MNLPRLCLTLALILVSSRSLKAEDVPAASAAETDATAAELKQDVVLRAMVDELERSRKGIRLEGLATPYFIEYAFEDEREADVYAVLGTTIYKDDDHSRVLQASIRVGSYELDNSNYGSEPGTQGSCTLEDDYTAIRQAFWWATDREYKDVAENLEQKKAFMQSKLIESKPHDFSRETPVQYFEPRCGTTFDMDAFEKLVLAISNIFREFPDIQHSIVAVNGSAGDRYLINTEGTRMRTPFSHCRLVVYASLQAEDGMDLADMFQETFRRFEDLPSEEALSKKTREMVEQLLAVRKAPRMESYSGPVLFDAQALVGLFSENFSGEFAGGQRDVGDETSPDDFENKINKRVLPKFIDVIDDPTREQINGTPVLGHYKYDDQGVAAQPVRVVEKGRLKHLLMSRNPSKLYDKSNGHGRGLFSPSASSACLIMQPDVGQDEKEMFEEMMDICEDEDLEFGIRIKSLHGSDSPLVMYKVYPDGRQELVRGAEIALLDIKAFKRARAAGKDLYVQNEISGTTASTCAAPAMLFEDLDLGKIDRDFDRLPYLPNPLIRSNDDNQDLAKPDAPAAH